MSKEYDKFHQEYKNVIEGLLESIDALIGKFNEGIVPGEPQKSDALYKLNAYKDAIEVFNNKISYKIIRSMKSLFDEVETYNELKRMKSSISLLAKLGREKLISIADEKFNTDAGKFLLESGYCDEMVFEETENRYYILSDKAEKALKSKKIIEQIRKNNREFVVPEKMIVEADKWSDLYARRVECLKKYYDEKKRDKEYILFTLDEKMEMVFGCELSDSLNVTYAFAGIFDEQIDNHVEQLKRIADSGLIDNIVVVIDSKENEEILVNEYIDLYHTHHILVDRL